MGTHSPQKAPNDAWHQIRDLSSYYEHHMSEQRPGRPPTWYVSSYHLSGVARSIFQAPNRSSMCECHEAWELHVRLWLGTYRKSDPRDNGEIDMFLYLPQVLQEVHIHAVRDVVVQLAINKQVVGASTELDYKPMLVRMLCNEIRKMQSMSSQRLELRVEGGQLLRLRFKDSCFQVNRGKQPITLQQLINGDSRLLKDTPRSILAVLLS
ncbi:hypothetical protein B0J13DRAFT_322451 [Dactylonectria estremocensis]|uniref:Uncharacterized protein n=1 Tax=Dactylonectria estremocensis TaxID=1079267 RepID=A0A9P9J5K7_9HYPO|nr:hypothetical protein B0J13DRAFT_322451 [Dactylonectria estremocensis]